jgi:hypothetical protein
MVLSFWSKFCYVVERGFEVFVFEFKYFVWIYLFYLNLLMIYKVLDFQLSFDRMYFGYKYQYFVKYGFGDVLRILF